MFDVLGLKPQAGVNFKGPKQKESVTHEALKKMASRPAKKKKEVVGDGEEIEVDENDEEVLSTNDINNIYKKSAFHFSSLVCLPDSRILERNTTIRLWVRWSRLIHSA